ncbi:MAG: hypothetical protein ACWGNK_15340, partial [Desulfobacterales bacterium]
APCSMLEVRPCLSVNVCTPCRSLLSGIEKAAAVLAQRLNKNMAKYKSCLAIFFLTRHYGVTIIGVNNPYNATFALR